MRNRLAVIVALLLLAVGCRPSPAPQPPSPAQANSLKASFGAHAIALWGSDRPAFAPSPDGALKVITHWDGADQAADDTPAERLSVETAGAPSFPIAIRGGVGTEVLWAPDSQGFALTYSEQGLVGAYVLKVITREGASWRVRDLTALVAGAYGHPNKCYDPEPVNVAAVAWLADGRLLAIGQTPPHSSCDDFGTFKAYEIDLKAERIVAAHDQIEAKRLFPAELGPTLLAANDAWVKDPPSGFIAALHPERAAAGR